jgi:hypothetical protein
MKRFGLLAPFLLIAGMALAQEPVLLSQKSFNFGGGTDIAFSFSFNSSDIYAGGYYSVLGIGAGITKLSRTGNSGWTVTSSSAPGVISGQAGTKALRTEDAVFWLFGDGTVKKLRGDGSEAWSIKPAGTVLYAEPSASDTLLAVSVENQPRLFSISSGGQVLSAVPLQGSFFGVVTLRRLGNFVWVFGWDYVLPVPGGNAFAAMFNATTGEKLWEVDVPQCVTSYGDVDENGNAYFAVNPYAVIPPNINIYYSFLVISLDLSGNERWRREWLPAGHSYNANSENYVGGVAVSGDAKGELVILGETDRSLTQHTGERSAYATGMDAKTGDSLWARSWEFESGTIVSQVFDGRFDENNRLVLLGNSLSSLNGNPPSHEFLETYFIPGVSIGLALTAPDTGTFWGAGTAATAQWLMNGVSGTVSLFLSQDGGATYPFRLASGITNTGNATVTAPKIVSQFCRVKIVSDADSAVSATSPFDFTTAYAIWPGDATNDGTVDIRDFLPLLTFYGETGPARPNASPSWTLQPLVTAWNIFDAAFADGNGDGKVDDKDIAVLLENWGATRASGAPPNADMRAVCDELLAALENQGNAPGVQAMRNAIIAYRHDVLGVPEEFVLLQNFPNPWNPATTIRFSLPEPAPLVTLTIVNVLGQTVFEWNWNGLGFGDHEVVWHGETSDGGRAASGVYFYRLEAGTRTAVKKMLLLK